jgi:hypothetical protein
MAGGGREQLLLQLGTASKHMWHNKLRSATTDKGNEVFVFFGGGRGGLNGSAPWEVCGDQAG